MSLKSVPAPSSAAPVPASGPSAAELEAIAGCESVDLLLPDMNGLLRGKRIAVTQLGSTFHYQLGNILEKEGMSLKDVTIVPLQAMPAALEALKGKQVDAVMLPQPFPGRAEADGHDRPGDHHEPHVPCRPAPEAPDRPDGGHRASSREKHGVRPRTIEAGHHPASAKSHWFAATNTVRRRNHELTTTARTTASRVIVPARANSVRVRERRAQLIAATHRRAPRAR